MADLPEEGVGRPDGAAFGRAMAAGLSVNLLVGDVGRAARWQAGVLGAEVLYWDRDFALVTAHGSVWMLHHDRTYGRHPLVGIAQGAGGRGAGAELRLTGCDPDRAERAAEAAGGTVLAGAEDKPHGVREAFLLDPEGYCWVPTVPLPG